MPNFMGNWFSQDDVEELRDLYHASMLALFQLWTSITNLKAKGQTFKEAFNDFWKNTDSTTKDRMANIQYQYECSDSTSKKQQASEQHPVMPIEPTAGELIEGVVTLEKGVQGEDVPVCFTTRDVELGIASEFLIEDKLYAEAAINIAIDYKIFSNMLPRRPIQGKLAKPTTN